MSEHFHRLWGNRLYKIDRGVNNKFALNWLWRSVKRELNEPLDAITEAL